MSKRTPLSPEFLDHVYKNAAVGLCYVDTQLRYQHINEWLAALHGLSIEAHLGRTVREVLPALADGIESQLRHVIETGEPTIEGSVEVETPAFPGVLRTFSHNYHPVKTEDGTVTGVSCFVQDVTERDLAANRARKERELYETLFQESPGMYIVSPNQGGVPVVETCNDRFLHTLGWAKEEVVGRPVSDFYTPASRDRMKSYGFQQALQGEPLDEERELVTREGRVITTIIHTTPITDSNGNVTGTRGLFTDITERKRAEEKLAFQASLLEQVHNGIIALDLNNKITYWNKYAEELYQWTREEAVGKDIVELLSPEEMKSTVIGNIRAIQREGHWEGEFDVKRKDGSTIPALIINTVLKNLSGNDIGILGISSDITERKKAEEEIRKVNEELEKRVEQRTAQLEAANKELEAFAYSVSHELRGPPRAMDGFSQALLDDYGDQLDSQGKEYLEFVRAASERMSELIEGLLNLSRVTRVEIGSAPVDLSAVAHTVIADLRRSQPDRTAECAIAPGLMVQGDEQLLGVVVDNLLGNAWKFTAGRDEARIELGVLSPSDAEAADRAGKPVYFVRDNGVGFDMAYSDKLFGTFQRLHSTEEFPGTGVGLATVQRIIHRHGGQIWAEAKENEGATFYFTI